MVIDVCDKKFSESHRFIAPRIMLDYPPCDSFDVVKEFHCTVIVVGILEVRKDDVRPFTRKPFYPLKEFFFGLTRGTYKEHPIGRADSGGVFADS